MMKKRARGAGRPAVPYRTVQMRVDEETVSVVRKLAALNGKSVPELLREWLLPLAREELVRQLGVESKKQERASNDPK